MAKNKDYELLEAKARIAELESALKMVKRKMKQLQGQMEIAVMDVGTFADRALDAKWCAKVRKQNEKYLKFLAERQDSDDSETT